jgi:hypothetical protein
VRETRGAGRRHRQTSSLNANSLKPKRHRQTTKTATERLGKPAICPCLDQQLKPLRQLGQG